MGKISRRGFIGAAAAATISAASVRSVQAESANRPNILFVLTDDQRWDTLGCMGNPVIITPNIDRLAKEGVVFDNCFVTTPICAVSRASVLSGQYARRHGIHDFDKRFTAEQNAELYPVLLRNAGYCTGFMGKWGVGANSNKRMDEASELFDFWAGAGFQSNYWHERNCPFVTADGFKDKTGNHCTCPPNGANGRTGHDGMKDPIHQETEIVPKRVEDFLKGRDANKPFCLSISFKSAHGPTKDYPESAALLYKDVWFPIPEAATTEAAKNLPAFLRKSLGSDRGERVAADHDALSNTMRHYYRMITAMDQAVGKISESLKQHGVADNTVIMFTSDNGFFLGDRGLFGKWLGYDPSIRVPGLIFDPRLPAENRGVRRKEMVLSIDFAPTMLAMAGVAAPTRMQGVSLVPLLQTKPDTWRDAFFFEHLYEHNGQIVPSEGVRTDRWKYIRYIKQDPIVEELYDLENDPYELRNMSADPTHASRLTELRARWEKYRTELI
jgi:arylsulfatase A-like enzyme